MVYQWFVNGIVKLEPFVYADFENELKNIGTELFGIKKSDIVYLQQRIAVRHVRV